MCATIFRNSKESAVLCSLCAESWSMLSVRTSKCADLIQRAKLTASVVIKLSNAAVSLVSRGNPPALCLSTS